MIHIQNIQDCCGCEACVQVCPKQCISFNQDQEGFFYPKTDEDMCVHCGLCSIVCPVLHPYEPQKPFETLAAINPDDEVRKTSSSGGVFTLLAEKVIDKGGIVFGARFDEEWQVVHDVAETKEALKVFRGSKYLQSRVGDSFIRCKNFLDAGRIVLFTGTPCQVAGLNHFLRKDYPNLLTVDFICHGAPSPLVWKYYLNEMVEISKIAIKDVNLANRNKQMKQSGFIIDYNEQQDVYKLSSTYHDNSYMQAFLRNLILRPSCHACPSKGGKSHSDITIADFWGIQNLYPTMDDDQGTSLVIVHTKRGIEAINKINFRRSKVSLNDALHFNSAYHTPAKAHRRRTEFFTNVSSTANLQKLIRDCLRPTLRQRLSFLKHPRSFINLLAGKRECLLAKKDCYTDKRKTLRISNITFRSKLHSWKHYEVCITMKPDKVNS